MKSIRHSINSKLYSNVFMNNYSYLDKASIDEGWYRPDKVIWDVIFNAVVTSVRDNFDQL